MRIAPREMLKPTLRKLISVHGFLPLDKTRTTISATHIPGTIDRFLIFCSAYSKSFYWKNYNFLKSDWLIQHYLSSKICYRTVE